MIKYFWLFFIVTLFHTVSVVAQSSDSLSVQWANYDEFGQLPSNDLDTSLTDVRIFDQHEGDFPQAGLGILGAFSESLNFSERWSTDHIGLGYNRYYTSMENLSYYQVFKPFTEMYYQLGANNEQKIYLTHAQNIKANWNMAADFRHLVSEGFYQNQKTSVYDVAITSRFVNKKKTYDLNAFLLYQETKNQDNGGVINLDFWDSSFFSTNSEPVYKTNAINDENGLEFGFKQRWRLGRTPLSDSTYQTPAKTQKFMEHELYARDGKWKYLDEQPDSTNYRNFFYSNDYTQYTVVDQDIINHLRFGISNATNSFFEFSIGHQYWTAQQFGNARLEAPFTIAPNNPKIDEQHLLAQVNAGVRLGASGPDVYLNTSIDFTEFEFDTNEHDFEAGIEQHFGRTLIKLDAHWMEQGSSFIQSEMESNHYRWSTDFENTQKYGGTVELTNDTLGVHATLGLDQYEKYKYFNASANPEQLQDAFRHYFVSLNKNTYWKKWRFQTSVLYQQTSLSESNDVVDIPDWSIKQNIGYETKLFRMAIDAHFGIEARYLSDFMVSDFNSLNGIFYLNQPVNQDPYLRLDAYARFKIKRARFFFRMDHLNQDVNAPGNFLVFGYPQPDRNFKFGVNWRFYD